ncbi:hypothetical protein M408DRAFT_29879 [Serendipita vermifera MAFF 305830]|uniref:Uncharacterized protein n=1 Tax=Serendipita vermifera MAFF 305830 TaxID=933852 RepID=A0A0C2WUD5_SERVB|nr:hypothetical protein M408DRAFT_29879 [Serendipita vermifera MAFF 305830]
MSLRPVRLRLKRLSPANATTLLAISQSVVPTNVRNASRLSRRVAARTTSTPSQELPTNTPKTLSSWEKPPAVPPKKAYWKTFVLLGYIGGPAYAFYAWSTWKPTVSS